MYQILICDDEAVFAHHLAGQIRKILTGHNIPCRIFIYTTPQELLSHIHTSTPDLLFLDILLEKDNGIRLAGQIRKAWKNIPIIFITDTMDYVLEGYSVESSGYLIKPVGTRKLEETLMRTYRRHGQRRVLIESAAQTFLLKRDEMMYLEIMNKKLCIHMTDGSVLEMALPLHTLLEKLPPEQFIQCHRSYVVSLPAIRSICRYSIELQNLEKIPVSKQQYKNIQNALLLWAAAQE